MIFHELRAAYTAEVDAFVRDIARRVDRGELTTTAQVGREIAIYALRPESAELAQVVGFMAPEAPDIRTAISVEDELNARRELDALAQLLFRHDLRVRVTRVLGPDMALVPVPPPIQPPRPAPG